MRVFVILILLLPVGCATASRHFRGAQVVRVNVDNSSFDIRLRGTLAEAVRINPQYAPRLGPLRSQAGFAMAKVSGCKVNGVLGDQAVMTGLLDCSAAVQPSVRLDYTCSDVLYWLRTRDPARQADYRCSPQH